MTDNALLNEKPDRLDGLIGDSDWVSQVYLMLSALSGVCDNAESKDDQGYSRADLIGHYLSELPLAYFDRSWAITALLLIRKYSRQLEGFGYDPKPFNDVLPSITQRELRDVRSDRSSRQLRRIRVLEDGCFEIYFPNRSSMQGFNQYLPIAYDWIEEVSIPHGYAFVVRRFTRSFVAGVLEAFDAWLIDDIAKDALSDNSLDSFGIIEATNYHLYIEGDDLAGELIFRWNDRHLFLDQVRSFSKRTFDETGPYWRVLIKTAVDVDTLNGMLSMEGIHVYMSPALREAWSNRQAFISSLLESDLAEHRLKEEKRLLNMPRGVVKQVDNHFEIRFTKYQQYLVEWVKGNLSGRVYNTDPDTHWVAPVKPNNIVAIHSLIGNVDWIIDEELASSIQSSIEDVRQQIANEEENVIEAFRVSSLNEADNGFTYPADIIAGELLPFQPVVLQYNAIRKNMLIGDDMGLGKSLSALACASINDLIDSVVITCPSIARLTWRDEINRWLPGRTVYICRKATSAKNALKELDAIRAADFVIVSYKKLAIYRDALIGKSAKLFIGDESQMLKNEKSQRTIAATAIADACQFVYLLSGTAIKNRPKELVTQLRILRLLDTSFGGAMKFMMRYCNPVNNGFGWDFSGSSNLDELRRRLRELCMVRRLKDDVMSYLPQKRRIRLPVEISNRNEYKKAESDFKAAITASANEKLEKAADIEGLSGKHRKAFIKDNFSDCVARAARAQMLVHTQILRKLVGQGLQDSACEWIETNCGEGDPLVVFAYHEEQVDYLYRTLSDNSSLRVARIVSCMSDEARKRAEKDFQAGLYDVVVCSLMTANTNITLVAATRMLIMEYWWVPGDLVQAEDRIRRIGTSLDAESIDCYYLHAEDTVADSVWRVLVSKFDVIEKAFDRDDGVGFDNLNEDVKAVVLNEMMERYGFVRSDKVSQIPPVLIN